MITLRSEQPGDANGIHSLHVASFPTDAQARLVETLRVAGRLRGSTVAIDGNEVIGHVVCSPVELEGTLGGLGLAPLAVRADHRRNGLGAQLVRHALASCRAATFVVVLGSPRYYGRFGFLPASDWNLRDEFEGGDAFQALETVRGAIPSGGGVVRYAPEFGVFLPSM